MAVHVQWRRAGPELEFRLSRRGTTTNIELVGECDLAARAGIQDAIPQVLTPDTESVVLDLGRVKLHRRQRCRHRPRPREARASSAGAPGDLSRPTRGAARLCDVPADRSAAFSADISAAPSGATSRIAYDRRYRSRRCSLLPPAAAPVVRLGLGTGTEPAPPAWFSQAPQGRTLFGTVFVTRHRALINGSRSTFLAHRCGSRAARLPFFAPWTFPRCAIW